MPILDMIPIAAWIKQWGRTILIVIAVASACFFLGRCDGARKERAAWAQKAAETALAATKLQRAADEALRRSEALQTAQIASNRQEIDNAVRDIPDQATSARQRARACVQLRRQGATPAAIVAAGCPATPG